MHACTHTTSRHYPSHTCNLFLQVGLPWRHTPTHIPLSIISGILYLSRVHEQWSMFLYVCVYIARSFIVFHTNRSIDISSEVSPSFPCPHWSIYTSLYRITYTANTPTLIIYPTSPSHHPCLPLHLSDARKVAKTGGSKGPAPLTSLYIEVNMNVIIRSIVGKMI